MNRKELKEITTSFEKNEKRLKSLKAGEKIYELELADHFGGSYFEHEVVKVDLEEMCVHTRDLSLDGKPKVLYGFYTVKEAGFTK